LQTLRFRDMSQGGIAMKSQQPYIGSQTFPDRDGRRSILAGERNFCQSEQGQTASKGWGRGVPPERFETLGSHIQLSLGKGPGRHVNRRTRG
jgi:hypothetical protein